MQRRRTLYPAEFRAQMVELMRAGRTPRNSRRSSGPLPRRSTAWVSQVDRDVGKLHDGLTAVECEELSRLRRENRQLKLARDSCWRSSPAASTSESSANRLRMRVAMPIGCGVMDDSLPDGSRLR
jgi:transposase